MRRPNFLTLTVVLLFLFIFPNLSQADHGQVDLTQIVDGYQVELMFAAGHPQTGSNELAIKLHSPHGDPLADTIVTVSVVRPEAGEALPHQEAEANLHDQAQVNDPQGGAEAHPQPETTPDEAAPMLLDDSHGEMADMDMSEHDQPVSAGPVEPAGHPAGEPAHGDGGHGEAAEVALTANSNQGDYTGQVSFSDTGQWHLKVHFDVAGAIKEANFTVVAAQNPSRWFVIGGFLGLNGLVVLAAAITKRKYMNTKKGKASA